MKNLQEEDRYLRAKKRVTELKALYIHILISVILIPFLILVNYLTYWDFKWFWFPMGGILVSIIIHAITVFKTGSDWEDRKIRELMDKDNF
ncbi:2TM domain-containing protein [Flaviramulus sp. BrNp1-15]|uniref:2TM domain-containing protein n=1 Tax=Flaviramulus sp. BrNp1-15 TaxID=2916754 RepID=UPI001EE8690D|nr:2TM domain-containing protein [Flaviramulus sp. BrNp1-15]ULC59099.1 2TM domain-containing protein [Flaviramulus sp. BrNp1-15]